MSTNTCWSFAGNAWYAGSQWLVFVLLVKSLGPADVGQFAYGLAVTGPIFVLANVRLRNLLATGVRTPNDFFDYFAARLLTTGTAIGAVLLIGAMATTSLHSFAVLALIASAKACDAMSDICHGLFQRELDMRSAAIGLMTNGTLSVILVASSLAASHSLTLAAAAYAAGSLAALVAWDLPRVGRPAFCRSGGSSAPTLTLVRILIRRAMPLGLSAALGSAQANFPRYVIAAHLGPASLAIFTALAYIPTLGNLIVNAVAQASLPVLARDLHASPDRYRARLRRLVIAGAALGVGSLTATALLGRPVLAWIYSAEYASQIPVLLALVAAAAVSYSFVFLGTASTARMRFGSQLLISTAGLVVVACSAGPLVARFGLVGAACALIAGAAVEGCAYAVLTVRDLRLLDGRGAGVPGALPEGVRS